MTSARGKAEIAEMYEEIEEVGKGKVKWILFCLFSFAVLQFKSLNAKTKENLLSLTKFNIKTFKLFS